MSKIKAVRFINLNYNNSAMRIDDEIFELGGESTLLSLRNGGGKSVLVQMMMAPFVNKRYRDLKDRTFESYFTTNKPTFILVEWELDHQGGYVLTGMMVRKRQEIQEERSNETLEMINFIYEYKQTNSYDIYHLPLVEKTEKGKKLVSFSQARNLFEKLKKEPNYKFNYYDMSQSNQARRYFQHLQENQIHHKEWESIMRRINLKESGLSELFQKAKSVSGLVEEWFLKVVADKLNREDDKIQRFNENIEKYIRQYKTNQSKIERKDRILGFREESEKIFQVAKAFAKELRDKESAENEIANFIKALEDKLQELELKGMGLENEKEAINKEIEELKYEALCVAIYELLDEQDELVKEQLKCSDRAQKLKNEENIFKIKLAIQICAKVHEEYVIDSQEVQTYENDLAVLHEKDKDLTPEKNNLGYTLKKHYKERYESCKQSQNQLEETLEQQAEQMDNLQKDIYQKRESKSRLEREQGSYTEKVKSYDKVEEQFNKKYKEDLRRNILGMYQDEILYTKQLEVKRALEDGEKNIRLLKHEKEELDEKLKGLEKTKEDSKTKQLQKEYTLKAQEEKLEIFEQELAIRREILKYIGLKEEKSFDYEGILACFDEQIEELKKAKLKDEVTYEKQVEAYKKLETGKLLSLSSEVEEKLEELGIHATYGMEWLRKNKIETAENPFLPYSLIMSQKEIAILKNAKLNIYTESPIPIISRENLLVSSHIEMEHFYPYNGVNFLVAFNEDLLNSEALARLLETKRKENEMLKEQIQNREHAINLNESKRNTVFYQRVTKNSYDETKEAILNLKQEKNQLTIEGDRIAKALVEVKGYIVTIIETLKKRQESISFFKEKLNNLDSLSKDYGFYLEDKNVYEMNKTKLIEMEEWFSSSYEQVSILEREKEALRTKQRELDSELKTIQEKCDNYESYKEGDFIVRDIEDVEARFESLTKAISQKESEIEELLKKARARYNRKESELLRLSNEYQLEEKTYKDVSYDFIEERNFKNHIIQIEEKISQLREEHAKIDSKKAVNEDRLNREQEKLKDEHHKSLKDKEELVDKNFDQIIVYKKSLLKTLKEEEKSWQQEMNTYQSVMTATDEYKDFKINKEIAIALDRKTVATLRGGLIRDYNEKKETTRVYEAELHKTIAALLRKEEFEDIFFKGPLETLERIVAKPQMVMENLQTTLEAYEKIMEKLEADIELIEKEKQSVLDGLLQYIYEVHEHIGKIDKNATVTIRGKSIKMLKIEQPKWDEYEAVYEVRLRDLLEYITRAALEKLGQNENIEELLSKSITTKNLYNEVVGINNIEVNLYKIEEEREYSITWDEVAKNSGGEGFLSAFVILSSLLSYMRRDDTDLFGMEKESGKVLVMDNPFAQTNAAHLLKPLMEMAKKRNTQLICLSGLGGESIYNCFDNIYVLSLMSSKMQEGLKYMRSEHLKGEEESVEEMIAVQIQTDTIEQMQLF